MTNAQVSTARKFATAAFAGVVALSLMLPAQLAFADYSVDGSEAYSGSQDKDGTGSGGGTWSYEADGYEMTLTDYVGGSIEAYDQDLNIQLEGDNTINGYLGVDGGNLTINGDDSVYGLDKPSLTIAGDEDGEGGIWVEDGDLTIQDANIYLDAQYGFIETYDGNLDIINSATWRGDKNESAWIEVYSWDSDKFALTLKGSEINATSVYSRGTLTIDNTNLTVLPSKGAQEAIDAGQYDDVPWVVFAVMAYKGIELVGEDNGEVIKYTSEYGETWYYLYTGDDNKVELKASETPAYWGPQGMPKTGDALPLVGFGIAAAAAGLLSVYSLRRVANKNVK